MKLTAALPLLLVASSTAFAPSTTRSRAATPLFGYLDDLSKELYSETNNPDIDATHANTDMAKDKVDRLGPGDWSTYVEFDEFDGGDGQMGVAGDGNNQLEKFGSDVQPQLAKSKAMSAKNAWGTSTGYATKLIEEEGVEAVRAQQMENWMNQQEVLKKKNQHRAMTASFDTVDTSAEEDWRKLAKFGVERNEEFDLDETFGPVIPGDQIEAVVELHSRMTQNAVYEIAVKNEYMGFADFRAAFTADTNAYDWSISPKEGSMSNREPTEFVLRFKPQNPGYSEGYLVIETEDFKKTWKLMGTTA